MSNYYVYEWIRLDTNEPFYVGKGIGNRWCNLKRGNNHHFNNIVKSIPVAVNILLEDLEEEEAFEYECWYINEYKYNIRYDIVNLTDGGDAPPHGSGSKNNNYENYWSLEQKKKASERVISSGLYNGENNPRATKIMCVETGIIYSHIKEASDLLKMKNQVSITMSLNDDYKTAYGYHWCKINDNNISYMSEEYNRFVYLVECYSKLNNNNKALVCFEDSLILKTIKEINKLLHISKNEIRNKFNNHQTILHNNKTYIFARDYSRII